jgi:hypothetical protein
MNILHRKTGMPCRFSALFFFVSFIGLSVRAQWPTGSGTNSAGAYIYNNSSNVGIGNISPTTLLQVGAYDGYGGTPFPSSTLLKIYQPYNSTIQSASIDMGMANSNVRITAYGNVSNNTLGNLAFSTSHDGGALIEAMRITQDGNVGIGTGLPSAVLHVGATEGAGGTPYSSSTLLKVYQPFNSTIPSASIDIGLAQPHCRITGLGNGTDNTLGQMTISTLKHGTMTEAIRVDINGGVAINSPAGAYGYQLAVNGSAIFTSATVKLVGSWPDYVFQPKYALPSLDSVAGYIQAHHRLPEMPSADSVAKNGLNLGTTEASLLKKVEELTLYVIDQNKKLAEQQERIDKLERLVGQGSR